MAAQPIQPTNYRGSFGRKTVAHDPGRDPFQSRGRRSYARRNKCGERENNRRCQQWVSAARQGLEMLDSQQLSASWDARSGIKSTDKTGFYTTISYAKFDQFENTNSIATADVHARKAQTQMATTFDRAQTRRSNASRAPSISYSSSGKHRCYRTPL